MNKQIAEIIKEFLRVVVLAIIPVILLGLDLETGAIAINGQLVLVTGIVAVLKAIDKGIHNWGKLTENPSLSKGLTRFQDKTVVTFKTLQIDWSIGFFDYKLMLTKSVETLILILIKKLKKGKNARHNKANPKQNEGD